MIDEVLADILIRLRNGIDIARDQLPRIVEDPRSYQQEAMLLALLVVLLLIFLVLAGFALWEAFLDGRERRRLGVRVRKLRRWQIPATAVVVVFFALMIASIVPMIPQVGSACGTCHAVTVAVDSWSTSAHRQVSCYGCHAAPGPLGAMAASVGGLVRLLNPVEREGRVYEDSCLSCHRDLREGVVGTSVRMRHSDVLEASMSCIECHRRVGHSATEEIAVPIVNRNLMSLCLTCHNDVRASSECGTCHAGRPFDVASAPSGNADTPTPVTCKGCHESATESNCISCHGLEMPHPRPEFHRAHAGMSYSQPALCARCHESARASREQACACHDWDSNLHGTYSEWFPRHGPSAMSTGAGGCNCHDTAGFCGMCHDSSPF